MMDERRIETALAEVFGTTAPDVRHRVLVAAGAHRRTGSLWLVAAGVLVVLVAAVSERRAGEGAVARAAVQDPQPLAPPSTQRELRARLERVEGVALEALTVGDLRTIEDGRVAPEPIPERLSEQLVEAIAAGNPRRGVIAGRHARIVARAGADVLFEAYLTSCGTPNVDVPGIGVFVLPADLRSRLLEVIDAVGQRAAAAVGVVGAAQDVAALVQQGDGRLPGLAPRALAGEPWGWPELDRIRSVDDIDLVGSELAGSAKLAEHVVRWRPRVLRLGAAQQSEELFDRLPELAGDPAADRPLTELRLGAGEPVMAVAAPVGRRRGCVLCHQQGPRRPAPPAAAGPAWGRLTALRTVALHDHDADALASRLEGLERLPLLTSLDLAGSSLADVDPRRLQRLTGLRRLSLRGAVVDAGVLHALEEMRQLAELDLREALDEEAKALPPATIEALRTALPRTRIRHW